MALLTPKARLFSFASTLLLATLPAVVACSAVPEEPTDKPVPRGSSNPRENNDDEQTNTNNDNGGTSIGTPVPATPPPAPPAAPLIYAHTKDALYTYDSGTKALVPVGKLACLSATDRLLDIAVDGKGTVFGTTDEAFIAVNPTTASCTRIIAKTSLPNSLSFVPAGTLDATSEALVGYAFDATSNATKYVRIDTVTGVVSDVGALNPPTAVKKYESSGDIFSVAKDGNKTYLTVHEITATSGSPDSLAEIDPKTGTIKSIVGNTLQSDIYGLAYWGGKAYGFSGDGNVTEINLVTGVSNVVATLKDNNVAVPWFGAGVTTEAPTTK